MNSFQKQLIFIRILVLQAMLEGVLMNLRWVHGGKAVIFCVINETRRF